METIKAFEINIFNMLRFMWPSTISAFIVNVIIGVHSIKAYLNRTCTKAETCRDYAGRFVLLSSLMIRGRRLSRGSIPCRKKVAADENAEEYSKSINEHMEIENMHTSKTPKMRGKGCRVRLFLKTLVCLYIGMQATSNCPKI